MGVVIPLRGERPPLPSRHALFAEARQHMASAWQAWLRDRPPAEDVTMELQGTVAMLDAVQQLAGLERGDA